MKKDFPEHKSHEQGKVFNATNNSVVLGKDIQEDSLIISIDQVYKSFFLGICTGCMYYHVQQFENNATKK